VGPLLFQPCAEDLATRLAVNNTGSVLELACGTGILTRVLRTHLPSEPENFVCSSFTQLRCRMSAQGRVEPDFWLRTFLTAEMETVTKLVATAPIRPASQSAKDLRVTATRQQAGLGLTRMAHALMSPVNR